MLLQIFHRGSRSRLIHKRKHAIAYVRVLILVNAVYKKNKINKSGVILLNTDIFIVSDAETCLFSAYPKGLHLQNYLRNRLRKLFSGEKA